MLIIVQTLREGFRNFFAKGTPEECLELIPENQRLLAQTSRKGKASKTPGDFNLVIAETLDAATKLSDADCKNFWSYKPHRLQLRGIAPPRRICVLIEHIENVERSQALFACDVRLCLLFFTHEMDRIAATVSDQELKEGYGVTRKSIAIDRITALCELKRERVTEAARRTRTYLLMAQKMGLGILLMLGTITSL